MERAAEGAVGVPGAGAVVQECTLPPLLAASVAAAVVRLCIHSAAAGTLLETIAGHFPIPSDASVRVGDRVSYAMQQPWVQQATIKDSIVCCEPWDKQRYQQVPSPSTPRPSKPILRTQTRAAAANTRCCCKLSLLLQVLRACTLTVDLSIMPLGDGTPVAEKGISLSRGQRQRVVLGFSWFGLGLGLGFSIGRSG